MRFVDTNALIYAVSPQSQRDGAILAVARACGCDTICTEDLNDGQDSGGVRAINKL